MKVYGLPEGVTPPDFNDAFTNGRYDMAKDDANTARFQAELKAKLESMGFTGRLTGECVYFPMGDGKAAYMVAESKSKTILIHLPIGDAWSLPEWQTRGLTKTEVKKMVEGERAWRELFSKP